MDVIEILDRLVGFRSVVGRPNSEIVDWIANYLQEKGVAVSILPGPEGDRANLFATIGPKEREGYILSGHMDVVPAEELEWQSDPFRLRVADRLLFGRGTSDMKGFLAAVLASVPAIRSRRLERPIHLAFSYDEEAGCRGVPHLISRLPELCSSPIGAIIGEPSGMRAVRAHKGKAAGRIIIRGRAGHSSRPDLGRNAIHVMAKVLAKVVSEVKVLEEGPFDANFEPPYSSMQVGTVSGGTALNIIPDVCVAEIEARAIPGVRPTALLDTVRSYVQELAADGFHIEWQPMGDYPALSLAPTEPMAMLLEKLTGQSALPAVSYGTEAGLYQEAGIPSIICGPGEIHRAHKPNEFISCNELKDCQKLIEAVGEMLES